MYGLETDSEEMRRGDGGSASKNDTSTCDPLPCSFISSHSLRIRHHSFPPLQLKNHLFMQFYLIFHPIVLSDLLDWVTSFYYMIFPILEMSIVIFLVA